MNYKFPIIEHISQVEKVIKDLPEIPIIDKGDYKVIAYRLSTPELFPNVDNEEMAIRRECRGLIFDKSGKLISRPFHKFFNVNEKEETSTININLNIPHIITTKLDGSMVRPFIIDENIRWATKKGITDVSIQVEDFVNKNSKYYEFAKYCLYNNYTPIFEWISKQQRIILDYPEDNLILLAVRHINSGIYIPLQHPLNIF